MYFSYYSKSHLITYYSESSKIYDNFYPHYKILPNLSERYFYTADILFHPF